MAWTRTERAEYGNPYYNTRSNGGYSGCIEGSPVVPGLNVLCNCVGLANGAFNETYVRNSPGMSEGQKFAFVSDAKRFIDLANNFGIEVLPADTKTPPLGGMVVWGGTANHVAYISKVIDNNTITIHQSGWDTPEWEWDIRNVTRNQNGTNMWGYRGTCLGFIVNPAIDVVPPEPSIERPEIISFSQEDFNTVRINYNTNGIIGKTTKARLYIKWNSSTVSNTNYDVVKDATITGSTFIDVDFGYDISKMSTILQQINTSSTQYSLIKIYNLRSYSTYIDVCYQGSMRQAIPYLYTDGKWKRVKASIYTNKIWRSVQSRKR